MPPLGFYGLWSLCCFPQIMGIAEQVCMSTARFFGLIYSILPDYMTLCSPFWRDNHIESVCEVPHSHPVLWNPSLVQGWSLWMPLWCCSAPWCSLSSPVPTSWPPFSVDSPPQVVGRPSLLAPPIWLWSPLSIPWPWSWQSFLPPLCHQHPHVQTHHLQFWSKKMKRLW